MIDKLMAEYKINFLEIIVVKEWKPNNKEGNAKYPGMEWEMPRKGMKNKQARNEKCPGRDWKMPGREWKIPRQGMKNTQAGIEK